MALVLLPVTGERVAVSILHGAISMALIEVEKALISISTKGSLLAVALLLVFHEHALKGFSLDDDFRVPCLLSMFPEPANHLA